METLSYKDVYERAWQCRDFELTNFWQRSAFLGTFMVLTYAGYGALCLALFGCEGPLSANRWLLFNGFAVGVALFGALFSALWILMAKGSKAWFEWHEAAINALQAELPEAAFGLEEVKNLAAFQVMKLPAFKHHWHKSGRNTCYLSTNNGPFSVSRITICLGQISLIDCRGAPSLPHGWPTKNSGLPYAQRRVSGLPASLLRWSLYRRLSS